MTLAADLVTALDPVRLAERAGIQPDSWQTDVLRSTAPRLLLNCSRQSGKSTTTAILALHTALYEPGALVLIVSRGERQSRELFRKVIDIYRRLDRPVMPEVENKLELELTGGSRIVALPGQGDTIRSFSGVRLLVVDEASRVLDATYFAVSPMLAVSGGRLVALSTPAGRRGWWFDAWEHGGDGWQRFEVPATACPRIPAAFLAEERANLPPYVYAAEYECQFTATDDAAFDPDAIANAFVDDASVEPLFPLES